MHTYVSNFFCLLIQELILIHKNFAIALSFHQMFEVSCFNTVIILLKTTHVKKMLIVMEMGTAMLGLAVATLVMNMLQTAHLMDVSISQIFYLKEKASTNSNPANKISALINKCKS